MPVPHKFSVGLKSGPAKPAGADLNHYCLNSIFDSTSPLTFAFGPTVWPTRESAIIFRPPVDCRLKP
ncbi:hypothetical protein MTP99_017818 [Tenebrio molitor]|nr:hypothetical protein MTP99_017818 [Tenebrio molitor]